MRAYRREYARRYALWRAYEMKCFYCGKPVEFSKTTVDHVIPESLADDPAELSNVLRDYEIYTSFPSFEIDGLMNLVPADGNLCNVRKGNKLLPKATVLFYLSEVKSRIPNVIRELDRLQETSRRGNALGKFAASFEAGEITIDDVVRIMKDMKYREVEESPLVVTFGLNWIETVGIRQFNLKEDGAYAILCDKLENELVGFLREKSTYSFHHAEASQRTGETLSVRLVFPEVASTEAALLPLQDVHQAMPWWELLEMDAFRAIYGISYEEAALS